MIPKQKRWRSPKYRAWVKKRPCCLCSGSSCDPHHVIGLHWNLSGGGLTAPDSYAMPLCRTCHSEVHKSAELQQLQPEWLELTLRDAVIEFEGAIRDELVEALEFVEGKINE